MVSAGHESIQRKGWKVSDTLLGLTCVFGLQGLFGFKPHGLAVLLHLEVARLFPWAWTNFQKVPAVYQELQVYVTLQTCGEDKDKTTHVVILSKLIISLWKADLWHMSFPTSQHPFFLWRETKGLYCPSEVQLRKEVRNPPFQLLRKKTWF